MSIRRIKFMINEISNSGYPVFCWLGGDELICRNKEYMAEDVLNIYHMCESVTGRTRSLKQWKEYIIADVASKTFRIIHDDCYYTKNSHQDKQKLAEMMERLHSYSVNNPDLKDGFALIACSRDGKKTNVMPIFDNIECEHIGKSHIPLVITLMVKNDCYIDRCMDALINRIDGG